MDYIENERFLNEFKDYPLIKMIRGEFEGTEYDKKWVLLYTYLCEMKNYMEITKKQRVITEEDVNDVYHIIIRDINNFQKLDIY